MCCIHRGIHLKFIKTVVVNFQKIKKIYNIYRNQQENRSINKRIKYWQENYHIENIKKIKNKYKKSDKRKKGKKGVCNSPCSGYTTVKPYIITNYSFWVHKYISDQLMPTDIVFQLLSYPTINTHKEIIWLYGMGEAEWQYQQAYSNWILYIINSSSAEKNVAAWSLLCVFHTQFRENRKRRRSILCSKLTYVLCSFCMNYTLTVWFGVVVRYEKRLRNLDVSVVNT